MPLRKGISWTRRRWRSCWLERAFSPMRLEATTASPPSSGSLYLHVRSGRLSTVRPSTATPALRLPLLFLLGTLFSFFNTVMADSGSATSTQQQGARWERLWTSSHFQQQPANRRSHGMTLGHNATLYLHGGVGIVGGLNDMWSFGLDDVPQSWTYIRQSAGSDLSFAVPDPRAGHSFLAVHEGGDASPPSLYMFGGATLPGGSYKVAYTTGTNQMLKFTFDNGSRDSGTWDIVPSSSQVPDARCDHSSTLYTDPSTQQSKLLIFGGRSIDPNPAVFDVAFGDLWSFDFATSTWALLSNGGSGRGGPGPRFAHAAALIEDGRKLVVWGGLSFYGESFYVLDSLHVFDLATSTWSELRLEVPLTRSFMTMATAAGGALYGFAGYVVFQTPSVAFVFNDLLVLQAGKPYWQKFQPPSSAVGEVPGVRYDHRSVVVHNGSMLVVYGGGYQSVDDVGGDVWMIDTSKILPSQLTKAPAEGGLGAYYGRLVFVFLSIMIVCTGGCCMSFRARLNSMQRRRLMHPQRQHEQALAAATGTMPEPVGISEEAIQALPLVPYHGQPPPPHQEHRHQHRRNSSSSVDGGGGPGDQDRDMCCICLVDYVQDEPLRELPCRHRFHADCVDAWLRQSRLCPMCKQQAGTSTTTATNNSRNSGAATAAGGLGAGFLSSRASASTTTSGTAAWAPQLLRTSSSASSSSDTTSASPFLHGGRRASSGGGTSLTMPSAFNVPLLHHLYYRGEGSAWGRSNNNNSSNRRAGSQSSGTSHHHLVVLASSTGSVRHASEVELTDPLQDGVGSDDDRQFSTPPPSRAAVARLLPEEGGENRGASGGRAGGGAGGRMGGMSSMV